MTLIFELDLHSVKLNQYTVYLGQRSFSSRVIVAVAASLDVSTTLVYIEPGYY